MKNLYSENPIKIMDKIESIEDSYRNKNKEQCKKKTNDIQDIQEFDYDKNYGKDDEKEKTIDNDLLSKTNSQKSSKNKKVYSNALGGKSLFINNLKTLKTESEKNINSQTDKNDFNISVSNINSKCFFNK